MAVEHHPSLKVLSSKRLPQPIKFPFTAYSHKHDLLAIVVGPSSGDLAWEIQVFRIVSGQIAFSIKRSDAAFSESDLEVTAIAWKPDGTSLGVGWSDGKYGIYDGGTGRQMSLVELPLEGLMEEYALDLKLPLSTPITEAEGKTKRSHVAVLGFMEHEAPSKGRREATGKPAGVMTTDEWYDGVGREDVGDDIDRDATKAASKDIMAGLPRMIAAMDVAAALPRLSAIPSHGLVQPKSGPGASKFGTQAATDTQFDTQKGSIHNAVQTLLVCPHDGKIQVLVDETVKIGSMASAPRPIAHAAHPHVSTHAVLCKGAQADDAMRLTFLDLPLSILNGPLLHVIATNTKRIQTLLDYIVQTARCIQFDYTSNVDTPLRFVNVLTMDMKTKHPSDGDALANLYHLAMTGSFHPQVLEWIVDIVKDTNIRRWELHLNTMYGNVQCHLFENLLPALDRFSIALAALRGQAKYHEDSTSFECSPKFYDVLLENIDSIRLVAQKMLLIIQAEHRQFRAFIKWLKLQIEIAVAEPFSQNAMETEEREVPNIDYDLVLTYIKSTMLQSELAIFIEDRPTVEEGETCNKENFMKAVHIRDMSYQKTKQVIDQLNNRQEVKIKDVADPEALVNLSALVCGLVGRTHVAVQHLTEWQNRLAFPPVDPPAVMLDGWDTQALVLEMAMEVEEDGQYVTNVLGLNGEAVNQISLLSVVSSSKPTQNYLRRGDESVGRRHQWTQHNRKVSLGLDLLGDVLDAKFIHHVNSGFMALFRPQSEDVVLLVARTVHYQYTPDEPDEKPGILHHFSPDTNFRPEKLIIGGRPGKRLCIVFGNRGREWRVLDLDTGPHGVQAAPEDQEMDME